MLLCLLRIEGQCKREERGHGCSDGAGSAGGERGSGRREDSDKRGGEGGLGRAREVDSIR